jgi:hypothetical protein
MCFYTSTLKTNFHSTTLFPEETWEAPVSIIQQNLNDFRRVVETYIIGMTNNFMLQLYILTGNYHPDREKHPDVLSWKETSWQE